MSNDPIERNKIDQFWYNEVPAQADNMKDDSKGGIKPCPFCGSESKLHLNDKDNFYFIECTKCQASSSIMYNAGEDAKPHVIEAWNERAVQVEPQSIKPFTDFEFECLLAKHKDTSSPVFSYTQVENAFNDLLKLIRSQQEIVQKCDDRIDDVIKILDENDVLRQQVKDYDEWAVDVKRLCREMDAMMFGEEGAAKQASLCDIHKSVQELVNKQNGIDTIQEEEIEATKYYGKIIM